MFIPFTAEEDNFKHLDMQKVDNPEVKENEPSIREPEKHWNGRLKSRRGGTSGKRKSRFLRISLTLSVYLLDSPLLFPIWN